MTGALRRIFRGWRRDRSWGGCGASLVGTVVVLLLLTAGGSLSHAAESGVERRQHAYVERVARIQDVAESTAALLKDRTGTIDALDADLHAVIDSRLADLRRDLAQLRLPLRYAQVRIYTATDPASTLAGDLERLARQMQTLRRELAAAGETATADAAWTRTLWAVQNGVQQRRKASTEDLRRPELDTMAQRIFTIVNQWMRRVFSGGGGEVETSSGASPLVVSIAVLLLLALCALLLAAVARAVRSRRRTLPATAIPAPVAVSYPDEERLVDTLDWQEGEQLLSEGKTREALRAFFHAWVGMLHDVFDAPTPWRDATNHEWFAQAERMLPDQVRQDTARIIARFDLHWYGLTPPDVAMVEGCRDSLRAFLRQQPQQTASATAAPVIGEER